MRILVYAVDYPPRYGGIAVYTGNLLRELAAAGHEVTVVVEDAGEGGRAYDAAQPFETIRIRRPAVPALYRVYAYAKLASIFGRVRPDAVWFPFWFRYASLLAGIARRAGVPYAVTCHGEELAFSREPPKHSDRRLLRGYAGAARIFTNSEHSRRRVLARGLGAEVVSCGVDDRFFDVEPARVEAMRERLGLRGRRVILTVSRLDRYKGHDFVIRALPRIAAEVPEVVYVIGGVGGTRELLEGIARELEVEGRVRFAGYIPDDELALYYGLSDVFVMPSRDLKGNGVIEGFGIVYMEASAAGCPPVGSNGGGVTDAIVDGETGLLVDPTSVEAIGAALLRILRDRDLAMALGRAGRERASARFRWKDIAAGMARSLEGAVVARAGCA